MSTSITASQEWRIGALAATTALFFVSNIAIGVYSRHVAERDLREVEARVALLASFEQRSAAVDAVATGLAASRDAGAVRASLKTFEAAQADAAALAKARDLKPELRAAAASMLASGAEFVASTNAAAQSFSTRGDGEAQNRAAAAGVQAAKLRDRLTNDVEAARSGAKSSITAARARLAEDVGTAAVIAIISAMLCVMLGLIARRRLFQPLKMQVSAMRRLSAGDSDVIVDGVGAEMRGDLGDMGRAIVKLKDTLEQQRHFESDAAVAREVVESERRKKDEQDKYYVDAHAVFMTAITAALERLSAGDVKHRLSQPFIAEYEGVRNSFNIAAERMEKAILNIVARSTEIRGGADGILEAADELSRHIEEQASSLEETSASMEQMAATIRQNADNAQEASAAARETRDLAIAGGRVAERAVTAIEKIERSSRQATEIVSLIEEIAFQTNILALNAAVEAARAGDSGKGFAVVANEVRALSQRSSRSLKDIKSLIDSSAVDVAEGVGLVKQAGGQLTDIVRSVKKASDLVAEIAAASHEQATGVDQVSRAVANMDEMTQQNAGLVQETTASLHDAQASIADLQRVLAVFDVGGHAASGAERSLDDDWARRAQRIGENRITPRPSKRLRRGASVGAPRAPMGERDWQEL